jgi:hypothetical protein
MQNEMFARELYSRWDLFFTANVESIANEVFMQYDNPSETLQISRLDLDLGVFAENGFDEQFAIRFRQQLEDALLQCLHNPQPEQQAKITPETVFAFDMLKQFLLHGTLPWHVAEYRDIRSLFLKVLKENSRQLKQFLQTYGHYTSLQERLVYQLEDPELEKGVYLLESANATFICSYIQLLRAKYKTFEQQAIRESDYRHTVWFVVYAYLLNNRSSFFNKKTFIAQTLVRLAAKYNLNYSELLELVTRELQAFSDKLSMSPELFIILLQLQKELSEKRIKSTYSNAAQFYKTVCALLEKDMRNSVLPENSRETLIDILSRVDSCRLFLHQMKEPEILHLVPLVAPTESKIVIETAKTLDKQKEQGALQGKAGSEFRLLKWQIIFPVLFEKRGTGFNRKYFVYSVLRKIAAHYNIEISLLLDYFLDNKQAKPWLDKELLQIFLSIQQTENPVSPPQIVFPQIVFPQIETVDTGRAQYLQQWNISDLSKTKILHQLITQFSEEEKYRFIKQVVPDEQENIITYVQSLDRLNETTQHLQGKAGGEFHEVKWRFVFTVLSETEKDIFNYRHFVGSVLTGIAAHYNLTYFDLLQYFRQEELVRQLPSLLQMILRELYETERERQANIALKHGSETDRMKLTAALLPEGKTFVKTYIRALDAYQAKGVLQGKVSGDFRQIKWKFIFEILLEMRQTAFNKKQFVARTLRQMAAHYNLSFGELLSYFATTPAIFTGSEFAEVSRIVRELWIENHEILRGLPAWCRQYIEKYGKNPNYGKLEEFLRKLAKDNRSLSRDEIIRRIEKILGQKEIKDGKQEENGNEDKEKNATSDGIVPPDNSQLSTLHLQFLNNSGLVLLSPYLPRLFSMLDLTEQGKFKDRDAQIRAIFLLQYAVFGASDSGYPEHAMALNKLLTGFQTGSPIPRNLELTQQETGAVDSMLQGALGNWEKLKNTSLAGLREGFLQRNGKLEEREDMFHLTVEEKPYDMLIDSCPWSFKTIKFSWMKKGIEVKWR